MSIVFLNRSYWPDTEATGQLLTQLCEDLVQKNWDVSVVAGQPNSNVRGEEFQTTGAQNRNGVTIHRLKHTQFPKRHTLGRLANLLTYTRAVRGWTNRAQRYDFVVSETDPFFLPLVARRFAKRQRSKLIVYVQDVYPDIAVALGKAKPGPLVDHLRRMLKGAYLQAAKIIVLSSDMRDRLASWGIPKDRFEILPNWSDCSRVFPVKMNNQFRQEQNWNDKFVVMHSGNMGLSQPLVSVLEAARMLRDRPEIHFALVGDGAQRHHLQQKVAEFGLNNVQLLPYQPEDQLADSLSAADLHLICMHPDISGCLAPSKLYGILASGTPVLALAPNSTDLVHQVQSDRLGWTANPIDPPAIQAAIRCAFENVAERKIMSERARQIALESYDRHVVTNKFADMLARLETQVPA